MNIARSLSSLMKERGLSNSRLARELGVHTSTVSNWLNGKEVKSENVEALCNYFGCSMDFLAGIEETKKAPSGLGEGIPHREKREVLAASGIRLYLDADAKLTDDQLDDIVDFIRFQQEKNGR